MSDIIIPSNSAGTEENTQESTEESILSDSDRLLVLEEEFGKMIHMIDMMSKEFEKFGMLVIKIAVDTGIGEVDEKTKQLIIYKTPKTPDSKIITLN